jgi:hypothetical protein
MSGRTVTYDEIQMEILCMHNLTAQERHEMLAFIRDFKQSVSQEFMARVPERLRQKVEVRVT